MDLLNRVLFGGVTVKHAVILLVVAAIIGGVYKAMSGKKSMGGSHVVKRRCKSCGWAGEVSQFNKKCPKCAKVIEG